MPPFTFAYARGALGLPNVRSQLLFELVAAECALKRGSIAARQLQKQADGSLCTHHDLDTVAAVLSRHHADHFQRAVLTNHGARVIGALRGDRHDSSWRVASGLHGLRRRRVSAARGVSNEYHFDRHSRVDVARRRSDMAT